MWDTAKEALEKELNETKENKITRAFKRSGLCPIDPECEMWTKAIRQYAAFNKNSDTSSYPKIRKLRRGRSSRGKEVWIVNSNSGLTCPIAAFVFEDYRQMIADILKLLLTLSSEPKKKKKKRGRRAPNTSRGHSVKDHLADYERDDREAEKEKREKEEKKKKQEKDAAARENARIKQHDEDETEA